MHGHVLVEGKFIDQAGLSEQWHAVTGDSYIVDVRKIAEDDKIAPYVAKYATKPLHGDVIRSANHLDECICAVRGRRLVQPFGCWKGMGLEDPEPAGKAVMIGNVSHLIWSAREGDPQALRWVEVMHRKWPHLLECFGCPPPPAASSP